MHYTALAFNLSVCQCSKYAKSGMCILFRSCVSVHLPPHKYGSLDSTNTSTWIILYCLPESSYVEAQNIHVIISGDEAFGKHSWVNCKDGALTWRTPLYKKDEKEKENNE